MFTSIDKAWAGLLVPVIIYVAEAVMAGNKTPMEVILNPDMWVMAVASGFLVWLVPNKGATYE